MNGGKWGNAIGPPQLRRALIGATLLLKGDLHAPWQAEPPESGTPEAARANRGGDDLPGTKFGRSIRLALPRVSSAPLPVARRPGPVAAAARVSAASVKSGKAVSLGALAAALVAAEPRRLNPAPVPQRLVRQPRNNQPAPHLAGASLPQPANEPGSEGNSSAPKPLPQPAFGAGAQVPGALPQPIDTDAAALAISGPAPGDTAAGNGEEPALPEIAAPNSAPLPPPEPPAPDELALQSNADEAAPPAVSDLASPTTPVGETGTEPPVPEADTAAAPPEAAPGPAAIPASVSAPETPTSAQSEESAAPDLPQLAFGSSVITPLPVRAGDQPTVVEPVPAPGGNPAAEPAVSVGGTSSWARPQELSRAAVAPDQTETPAASGTDKAAGLPQPAFGQTALRSPHPPARTTLAYAVPQDAPALPRPQFGATAQSTGRDQSPALAAAATSSAAPSPLTGSGVATRSQAGTPQARTGYADTSPRIGGEAAPNFTSDDELVLQLQSERGEIADTIVAYGTRSGVYLPFSAVTRFLDLAISVSDDGHYASGWFIDESQTVSLNLRSGVLTAGGRELPLAKGDAAAFEGELYLRAERFADLFPLTLTVDLRAQAVTVKTRVPFPFEQRISREQQRQQLGTIGRKRDQPRWPREPTPWRALSFPLADAELRAVTDRTYGSRLEGDLRLAGDLAFMTARLFAGGTTRDGLTGARVELGRRDPDAGLLGPLKATEFQLGDVTTLALPIGLRGTSGRGAFVTNAPLEHASVFDMIDLYGDLPDGYEVELYRNNILIGSTRQPVNGQYQFRKVAVDYGLNVFRMVFYGPQGQRREDVRSISVGDGRLSPGQLVYSFGAAQKDTNLLDVHGPGFTPPFEYGAWRSSALVEYGLTRQLTAALGGAWFDGRFGKRWMATAGLRTGLAGTALKLDLGLQSGGGKAVEFGVGGKLFGLSYALTHAEYRGRFTDELQSFTGDVLRRSTGFNINTTLDLGGDKRPLLFPIYGQFRRVEFADGRKQTDAALRGSLPVGGLLFSNTLNYASNSAPGFGANSQLIGSFDLATLRGSRLQLRASADYAILPQPSLRGGMLQADYALDERTLVRASVGHTLEDSQTRFGLSAVRRFGQFTLAFDGTYGVPDASYNAALRLGFSFGRNPLSGRLFFAEPGLTSGGAVAVRAFRDTNGNRHFDSGEAVIPEVEFITSSRHGKTDASGLAFIGALGDGSRSSMTIDLETLPDIALAPVSEGIEVVPRAGRVHATDFAIQELSDIEGTAFFTEGAGLGREVSGLVLVLVDAQGKTVARARTEGDGSFYFEQLHPGEYLIAIDKNQAASLKIHLAEEIGLTIGAKSAWLKQVVKVSRD